MHPLTPFVESVRSYGSIKFFLDKSDTLTKESIVAKKGDSIAAVCRNKKASHRYEILEKIECGIVLHGGEVKSLRNKDVSLDEAYARIDGEELWLIGCHIAAYKFSHMLSPDTTRRKKLLVHSRELQKIKIRVDQKGCTLIPLAVYFNTRGIAKVSLGIVRGKQVADKRRDMKSRDHKREMERAMRGKR